MWHDGVKLRARWVLFRVRGFLSGVIAHEDNVSNPGKGERRENRQTSRLIAHPFNTILAIIAVRAGDRARAHVRIRFSDD